MSAPSGGGQTGGNKIYNFTGTNASISDTLRVPPAGLTVLINNPDYVHGAMITVRNKEYYDEDIEDNNVSFQIK